MHDNDECCCTCKKRKKPARLLFSNPATGKPPRLPASARGPKLLAPSPGMVDAGGSLPLDKPLTTAANATGGARKVTTQRVSPLRFIGAYLNGEGRGGKRRVTPLGWFVGV